MKQYWAKSWLAVFLVLSALALACAPRTPPVAPSPAPQAEPARPASVPAPAIASPQEQALAQLVDAARKEGKLTAYSFSFTGDIGLALQKGFEERYGIKADIISGRGAEMGERIRTERRTGNIVADFMETSPTNTTNLKVSGATVSTADLPAFMDKDVWRVDPFINDPEGHVLGHRAMNFGPYINTNLVKPGEEPRLYKDFLNPRWDGKFLAPDPNVSGGTYDILVTLLEYGKIDMDTVKALGPRARFVQGTRQIAEGLSRGEYPLGLGFSDNDAGPFLREGAPIKALNMQEGIVTLSSAMVRVKDGPHPNAARLFMNWMFTKEGQGIYTRVSGLASVRKDVPDSRHPGSRTDSPLLVTDYKIAEKQAQMFRDKVFVNLWKK